MTDTKTLSGIARQLVSQGLVSQEIALSAKEESEKNKVPFLTALMEHDEIESRPVAQYMAADLGLPLFDLNSLNADSIPTEYIKEELINSYNAVTSSHQDLALRRLLLKNVNLQICVRGRLTTPMHWLTILTIVLTWRLMDQTYLMLMMMNPELMRLQWCVLSTKSFWTP